MVIGIAGPTASGKTTVADHLATTLNATRLRYSMILAEMARERGLDPADKATLQNLFVTERSTRGEDFLAEELVTRTENIHTPHMVIEGNRRIVDVTALRTIAKRRNEPLRLMYIDASVPIRHERYNRRLVEQGELPVSYDAFIKLEQSPAEDELPILKKLFAAEGLLIHTDTHSKEEVVSAVDVFLHTA